MPGLPRHNTRPHASLPQSFLCMDDLKTERSFDSQAMWVIDALGFLFWHVVYECLYNQALADVRSTGAEIECLNCTGLIWLVKRACWIHAEDINTVSDCTRKDGALGFLLACPYIKKALDVNLQCHFPWSNDHASLCSKGTMLCILNCLFSYCFCYMCYF